MAEPDVRVRLSAEGVDEVVRALQKVQQAAQSAGKGGAGGLGLLNKALADLGGILPTIGIGAAVAGIGALAKHALDSADAIGKLSQKTGLSTQTLSVLNVAAETADVNFEQLGKALEKFDKTMGQLERGSSQAGEAVKRLFGDAKALNGLDTDQRFFKVAQAIAALPPGYQKAAAAMDFFGKSGAELIPLLNDISGGGFEEFRKKAEQLGLVVDKDLAEAAQRANDSLKELKQEARGVATQFVSGFAPALADAAKALKDATTSEGVSGFKTLGEVAGNVLKGIVSVFLIIGKTAGFVIGEIVNQWTEGMDGLGRVVDQFKAKGIKGLFDSKWREEGRKWVEDIKRQRSERFSEFGNDLLGSLDNLFNGGGAASGKPAGGGSGGGGSAAARSVIFARTQALLEAEKARVERELKIYKDAEALADQQAKEAYDRHLISLQEYYNKRREIIESESDQEIAALKRKREIQQREGENELAKLRHERENADETGGGEFATGKQDKVAALDDQIAAQTIKNREKLEAIDGEIESKRLERLKKIGALEAEQRKAEEEWKKRQLAAEQQLLEAQGQTYAAQLAHIRELGEQLRNEGVDPETIKALTDALDKKALFESFQRQGNAALSQLSLAQGAINLDEQAGKLFPVEAADEYRRAVEAALPGLRAYAQAMKDAAVTPEERLAAAEYAQRIEALGVSVNESAENMRQFKASVQSALTSDLTNFFTTGIQQAHSFGDAIRGLAQSIVNSLAQIAAQMLVNLAIKTLLKAVGGFSGGGVVGDSGGGGVEAADGGYISGPGTGTSDSIPARLSNGEFVVRAAAVAQPGVLPLLSAINGMTGGGARGLGGVARFADGGIVSGAGSGGGVNGQLRVGLEPGLIAREVAGVMSGPKGQEIVIEHIGNNRKKVSQTLGG